MYQTNPRPIRLYDCSILNIQERREQAIEFPTLTDAAEYLGVSRSTIRNNLGGRLFSPKRGREYAVRAVSLANGCGTAPAIRADTSEPKRA